MTDRVAFCMHLALSRSRFVCRMNIRVDTPDLLSSGTEEQRGGSAVFYAYSSGSK